MSKLPIIEIEPQKSYLLRLKIRDEVYYETVIYCDTIRMDHDENGVLSQELEIIQTDKRLFELVNPQPKDHE